MDDPRGPARVASATVLGVDGQVVTVETTMKGESGPPRLVGSVDSVVREAYHRVMHAFSACGLPAPRGTPLINFAPADLKKVGSGFDLPMALSIAQAGEVVPNRRGLAAFGELTLDGSVRSAPGIVATAIALRDHGYELLLCSREDARLAAAVPGLLVVGVETLSGAIGALAGLSGEAEAPVDPATVLSRAEVLREATDLSAFRGLETAKHALATAVAGRHDLLFVGPPGCGKTALLRCVDDLLPPLDPEECLEVLRVHTARNAAGHSGVGRSGRPVRAPHCSASGASVLGGGPDVRPGEVTLAHFGVLLLDELPEFRREVLEGLRQPLEERRVTIARARRTVTMPADFQLLAAMNPCPCGYDGCVGHACRCSRSSVARYRSRLSGPLLDRFDLRVRVSPIDPSTLESERKPDERSTAHWVEAIAKARQIQRDRNPKAQPNGRLEGPDLEDALGDPSSWRDAARTIVKTFSLSARGRLRVLRTSRTLADLRGAESPNELDLACAARMRRALS